MQKEQCDGDVPFIPQSDSSPLIIYQAGCLPQLLIEWRELVGGLELGGGNKIRLVEVKYTLLSEHTSNSAR